MGIPGLADQLHKYGQHVSLPEADNRTGRRIPAIIDGPSLAHSIFRLGNFDLTRHGIISQCDYRSIGNVALKWLDRLSLYGFEIEGVYFDGALPAYKRETRLDRLQGYTNKLVNYRQLQAQTSRTPQTSRLSMLDIRNQGALRKVRDGLPPPPFLVFAVVEALMASAYMSRTWLVDGEADSYCAAAAVEVLQSNPNAGATIFTNDSDLVIFNFRAEVQIAMINDTKETTSAAGNILELYILTPSTIKNQGVAVDLVSCAFYIQEHRGTLSEAFTKAKVQDSTTQGQREFRALYDVEPWKRKLQRLREGRANDSKRPNLDSRIAEPIYKAAQVIAEASGAVAAQPQADTQSQIELDMFLPVLFEDSMRASAWTVGKPFREAAQRLILYSTGSMVSLLEYRRSGTRIAPTRTSRFAADELNEALAQLSSDLPSLRLKISLSVPDGSSWQLLTMALTLQDLADQGHAIPAVEDVITVLAGGALTSWDLVHLSAQYQAQFYSIRMLQQVASWWESDSSRKSSFAIPSTLHEDLTGLLGIAAFFNRTRDATASDLQEEVVKMYDRLGLSEPAAEAKPKRKRRRTKAPKEAVDVTPRAANLASNPYALLDDAAG